MTIATKTKKFLTDAVKKELAPTRIIKINMREGESAYDGRPLCRIDVVVHEEDDIDTQKGMNLSLRVQNYFWDMKEEHFPLFTFLKPHEVRDYYHGAD